MFLLCVLCAASGEKAGYAADHYGRLFLISGAAEFDGFQHRRICRRAIAGAERYRHGHNFVLRYFSVDFVADIFYAGR